MKKKLLTISMLIGSIILMSFLVVKTTYSLINNVTDNRYDIRIITIRELVTDNNGIYKPEYYKIMSELDISNEEMNLLIESVELNKVLTSIINSERYSSNSIYELIVNAINNDKTIPDELKDKAIVKIKEYIGDIVNYLYDMNLWEVTT